MTAERLQASPRPTKPPVALDAAGGPISLAERLSIVERNSAARLLAIAEQPLRPVGDVHVACDRVAMIVGKPAAVPRTVTVAGAGMWRNGEARREQLRARQIRGRCAGAGELVASRSATRSTSRSAERREFCRERGGTSGGACGWCR